MRNKSSSAASSSQAWHRARLTWPIQRVPMILDVVHPRKLTALEWALLRVVDEFAQDPPDLEDVAQELGLMETAFLEDTLRQAVQIGALEPSDADTEWADLSDLQFTQKGHELFLRGEIEAAPAEHALDFHFDALTDELVPAPKPAGQLMGALFPVEAPVPEPRGPVGLDRVREIVRRRHPELLEGGGEVRGVKDSASGPSVTWVRRGLELGLSDDGEIEIVPGSLTEDAEAVVATCDPVAEGLLPRQTLSGRGNGLGSNAADGKLSFGQWSERTASTLASSNVQQEVLRMLRAAKREVMLHAVLHARPSVSACVSELAQAGIKVAIVGAESTEVLAFHEKPKPGFAVTCAGAEPMPVAVVVDGRSGVLVERVTLRYGIHRPMIELGGVLRESVATDIHRQYVELIADAIEPPTSPPKMAAPRVRAVDSKQTDAAVTKVLQDPELQLQLARLALVDDPGGVEICARRVTELAPGSERVPALARLGTLIGQLHGSPTEKCAQFALDAWTALLADLGTKADATIVRHLAAIAPDGATAEALIHAVFALVSPMSRESLCDASGALLALQQSVDERWGRKAARGVLEWQAMLDLVRRCGADELAPLLGKRPRRKTRKKSRRDKRRKQP